MNIFQRKYSSKNDLLEMIRLAGACQQATLHVTDLPYRLSSWAMDDPNNVGLWWDDTDRLVAWAVMQTPFWFIDYVMMPEMESELHPIVLAWADGRAKRVLGSQSGHPAWYVNVFDDQTERRQALQQAGFSDQSDVGEDSWSKVWMERSGESEIPSYHLPAGFTIRPLAGQAEVEAYVALHQAVFESKNMTITWRMRTLTQLDYSPELDIVITAPGGSLAAFCIGWLAKGLLGEVVGQVEPLGCLAEYRGYALGRLALCEVLQRMQQAGAQKIFVETDNHRNTAFRLYESVGFQVVRKVLVYRKDYNNPAE